MSIILKGLDIPKEYSVIIEIDEYGEVCEHIKGDQVIHIEPRAKAIQIPKNHGRLIDADLLKDTVRDSIPMYGIGVKIPTYGDMDIMDKIGFMPTILDKERE